MRSQSRISSSDPLLRRETRGSREYGRARRRFWPALPLARTSTPIPYRARPRCRDRVCHPRRRSTAPASMSRATPPKRRRTLGESAPLPSPQHLPRDLDHRPANERAIRGTVNRTSQLGESHPLRGSIHHCRGSRHLGGRVQQEGASGPPLRLRGQPRPPRGPTTPRSSCR